MLDETRLYERAAQKLHQRNRELALLNRASHIINATLDLDEVLVTVLEEVRGLLDVVACSVWLADPITNELVCRQATGPRTEMVKGWRLAPGEGIAGWVFTHRKSAIVADALRDERHYEAVEEKAGLVVRSILCVPLEVKQRPIGVLQVLDIEVDRFDEENLVLMEMLARSAAIAIDNARLVDALRRRTVELSSRNVELERIAYLASHHLRSPLVNLQGFAGELRHAFGEIDGVVANLLPHLTGEQQQIIQVVREDVTEALNFIELSVAEMGRLSDGLLKLSELSRFEFKLERVDVEDLVHTVLQSLGYPSNERDIEIMISPLPQVVADRKALTVIVETLLSNAMNYLLPARPGRIEISAESAPKEYIFHVRDNGRGIAEQDMDKVFAPFRRVGRHQNPGEGMGLVYAQTLVRRHEGRLCCESEAGVGTEFIFTIAKHLGKG
ncbi:MAG TPA: GAF domain-containing sensor histidine kinase [Chloroflexi bacterium]|nr:GAF domain-containing sensor histidine kinase [Chloroflexota bacterium]